MTDILHQLLQNQGGLDSEETRNRVISFYLKLQDENRVQNLTRLSSAEDFYYGHVCDVLELLQLKWVQFPALDMGSGGGIPGLLAATIEKGSWILTESEKRKAEYLLKTVEALKLADSVQVFPGRAEDYMKSHSVQSVVARAVGPTERIYGWIRKCSTWNNLILFKGPAWEQEWNQFQESKWKKELRIQSEHCYKVGPEQKTRKLILLSRV